MLEIFRRMHPRRAIDVLAGSLINKTKKVVAADISLLSKAVARGQSELNDQIRASSPNFYLVDPELLAKSYINYIINSKDATIKKQDKLINEGITELEYLFRKILEVNFKPITIDEVISNLDEIYKININELQKASSKSRKVYIEFQRIAVRAGESCRKYLNSIGVRRVTDASNFISNLNNRIAIVAPTFNIGVKNVNEKLQSAVSGASSFLKKYGITYLTPIYIGNIVHSGHVGIYSDSTLLGINMPSALIASAITNRGKDIEQAIGNIQIHIDSGIKVNPQYTQFAGMLLDLQLNFTISMPADLNSKILGPLEQQAIKSIVGNITNDALKTALSKQVSTESLTEVMTGITSSPTLLEYIAQSLVSTLTGKKLNPVKHTRVETGNLEKIINKNTSSIAKGKTSKVNAPPKKKVPVVSKKPVEPTKPTNLANLQALLNQALPQQIKRNMVKPALQNRTGRFAESVRVERLSESRAGMISAFYSYMKNPYATFSAGGAQHTNAREPKTLISKSIREIAAGLVGNRLRAVSI